jgi:endonuclease/exonuclease/phosphatase family metal-dependent hydrolase
MAFRNKWEHLAGSEPDIMVVPEAEQPDRLPKALLDRYPHALWIGDIPFKGLLVLGNEQHPLRSLQKTDPKHRFILPVEVAAADPFTLMAVWAQHDRSGKYTDHVMGALLEYEDLLDGRAVVIGDFNSNAVWDDQLGTSATHTDIVAWLAARRFISAYHHKTGEAQGHESVPTHAHLRRSERTFHIDHCFLSSELGIGLEVAVPPLESWIDWSDHAPLIVEVPLEG